MPNMYKKRNDETALISEAATCHKINLWWQWYIFFAVFAWHSGSNIPSL